MYEEALVLNNIEVFQRGFVIGLNGDNLISWWNGGARAMSCSS